MEDSQRDFAALVERPRPSIAFAVGTMLFAAAGMWLASLMVALLSTTDWVRQELLFEALFYLPAIALPIAVYMRRRPGLSDAMRFKPLPVLPTLAVVSAGVLSVYVASALDWLWAMSLDALGLHQPNLSVALPNSGALTLAILHSAAVPAIFEELLCRGLVFSAFESRGTRTGVWVSALLFALLHGNVYGLPAYLLVGAVSAFLVFALDSLYAGMAYHTVYNATILLLIYLIPESAGTAGTPAAVSTVAVAMDAAFIGLLLMLTLRTLDRRRRLVGIRAVPRVRAPLRRIEWALLIALGVVLIGTNALVLLGV